MEAVCSGCGRFRIVHPEAPSLFLRCVCGEPATTPNRALLDDSYSHLVKPLGMDEFYESMKPSNPQPVAKTGIDTMPEFLDAYADSIEITDEQNLTKGLTNEQQSLLDRIYEKFGMERPPWEETRKRLEEYIDNQWLEGMVKANATLIAAYEEKSPMEWLRELPENVYRKARERFKAHPLSVDPTERKNALREAFYWGCPGTEEYEFWLRQNQQWRNS